jgi:hypothetical protein
MRGVTVEALARAKHLSADFLRELGLHDLPGGGVGAARWQGGEQ